MEKQIVISPGKKEAIMEEFGISRVCVCKALKFETSSYLAHKLRERALEMGGRLYCEVSDPEMVRELMSHKNK